MTPLLIKAKIPKISLNSEKEKKKIARVFQRFDLNGDGVIDRNELKAALEPNFTEETINELFSTHSRRNSGLHLNEFTEMFIGK